MCFSYELFFTRSAHQVHALLSCQVSSFIMLIIDDIVKEKGIDQFNDLELMIYIMKYGTDEKVKGTKRKVVEAMERRMNLFYDKGK